MVSLGDLSKFKYDREFLVQCIGSLDPNNDIFRKDFVPPPRVPKNLESIPDIDFFNDDFFDGLPQTTNKKSGKRAMSKLLSLEAELKKR